MGWAFYTPHDFSACPNAQIVERNRVRLDGGDENSVCAASCQFDHFLDRIRLLEVHEIFGAQLHRKLSSLVTSVDDYSAQTHGDRELDTLDSDTATSAGEDCELTGSDS
jgi:hypothetical protein